MANESNLNSQDPLVIAASEGNLEEVKRLVESEKAPIDSSDNPTEVTPLVAAVQAGHLEVVNYLLDHGADLNFIRESDSTNLLGIAYKNSNQDIINAIIREAINQDLLEIFSHNPVEEHYYSRHYNHVIERDAFKIFKHFEILQLYEDDIPELILRCITKNYENSAKILDFVLTENPHLVNSEGDYDRQKLPLLQIAIYNGNTATVRVLLERGANLTVDPEKNIPLPLPLAVSQGYSEITELLYDFGQTIDIEAENAGNGHKLMYQAPNSSTLRLLTTKGLKALKHPPNTSFRYSPAAHWLSKPQRLSQTDLEFINELLSLNQDDAEFFNLALNQICLGLQSEHFTLNDFVKTIIEKLILRGANRKLALEICSKTIIIGLEKALAYPLEIAADIHIISQRDLITKIISGVLIFPEIERTIISNGKEAKTMVSVQEELYDLLSFLINTSEALDKMLGLRYINTIQNLLDLKPSKTYCEWCCDIEIELEHASNAELQTLSRLFNRLYSFQHIGLVNNRWSNKVNWSEEKTHYQFSNVPQTLEDRVKSLEQQLTERDAAISKLTEQVEALKANQASPFWSSHKQKNEDPNQANLELDPSHVRTVHSI